MIGRLKLFFLFYIAFLMPLVLLVLLHYWYDQRATEARTMLDLDRGLATISKSLTDHIDRNTEQLVALARSAPLQQLARAEGSSLKIGSNSDGRLLRETGDLATVNLPADLAAELATVCNQRTYFSQLVLFAPNNRILLAVEQDRNPTAVLHAVVRTHDFIPTDLRPNEQVWVMTTSNSVEPELHQSSFGATLVESVPVLIDGQPTVPLALVGELRLDPLLADVALPWEAANPNGPGGEENRMMIVLDSGGQVLYHPNQALRYQPASKVITDFAPIAERLARGERGHQSFTSRNGRQLAAFAPLPKAKLSLAIAQLQPGVSILETFPLLLAMLLAAAAALVASLYWQRRSRGLHRVTEGVAAIAKGELGHRIEASSSEDIRPLADNLNLMREQLRQQLAREAEARQFQSFVNLSAMLTHDLKNAIGALSLIVGNMEQHFDDQEFRADTMHALTGATTKLQALVERLSNPITTLSGEFKRPQPVDLVPMLSRVIANTKSMLGNHEIEIRLPDSLFAFVDSERIEKVAEILILNALEAMTRKPGRLTIEAGYTEEGKPFFSIGDTGVGMNAEFIEKKLFHPFATTKARGVGLGLYTCREVVRANGGTIEVNSKEGDGATFRVVLPSPALTGET